MIELIKECNANGVVFISGDVHWGELLLLKPPACYPLYDLTASGINQEWDELEPNQNRIGEDCMDHHFGMIEIDWTQEDPQVSLRIHDFSGRATCQSLEPGVRIAAAFCRGYGTAFGLSPTCSAVVKFPRFSARIGTNLAFLKGQTDETVRMVTRKMGPSPFFIRPHFRRRQKTCWQPDGNLGAN